MRIGCLQFAPQVGDIDNNLNRADAVLSKANPEDLDLLVLPELAFAGYNFKSLQEISPYLEPKGSGISALWARTVALKLNCVVTVGYAEKVDVKPKWPTSPEYYNSVIVVNPDGETIGNYRKSFLYYTDETWALEGQDGFYDAVIPGLGTTSMGICMDLNPYKFEAPWHAFEFAFHCLEVEANLVIVTMAWMTREDARLFSRMPKEPDMDTLTYWITRLEPIIRSDNQEEIIIVFCNRTGIEDEAVYAGTSAVVGVKDGEVNVYGLLGRGQKDLLVVDTEAAPYAKLVYRPDSHGTVVASVVESTSDTEDANQKDSGKDMRTKSPPAQSSLETSSKGTISIPSTQNQMQLEEARQISQPQSPISQISHSSHRSYSSKRSYSSHQSRSSQKSRSSQNSLSTQRSNSSQKSQSAYKATPTSGVTNDYHHVPLGISRAGSDRSTKSMQGSVSSQTSSTSNVSKGSSRLTSRDITVSQRSTFSRGNPRREKPRSPPIQIPLPRTETDTIPTPTGPSPTPLAVRPKLIIPKDAHQRPAVPHVPTPHPSVGAKSQSARTYSGNALGQQQNEIPTPTTAFDDVTPQSPNRFFWIPSDTLLKTPMEPRTCTPARADSPTLSMRTPGAPQAYVKNTATATAQPADPKLITRGTTPSGKARSNSKLRAESKSLGQHTEPMSTKNKACDPVELSLTSSRRANHSKNIDHADSPFTNRPDWAAIAERLDALSPHPDSMAAQTTESFAPGAVSNISRQNEVKEKSSKRMPARPSSPKSRNASRNRAANPISADDPLGEQRQENISRTAIIIGVGASMLDNKPPRGPSAMCRPDSRMSNVEPTYRSMPRAAHSRSNSVSLGQVSHTPGHEDVSGNRPQSRAASRGRQRALNDVQHEQSESAQANPRDCSTPARRPSAPSFRFRSPAEFEAEIKRISPEWSVQAYYGDTGTGDENEIIGEIIVRRSPSCAVHGSRAQGNPPQGNESKTPQSDACQEVDDEQQGLTRLKYSMAEEMETTPKRVEENTNASVQITIDDALLSPNNYSSSVETIESSKVSPETPQSLSNPKTPKSVCLIRESDSSIPTTPLSAPFVKPLRVAKFAVQGAVSDIIIRPKSAVW
ncbi:hypothetical protein F5Y19DRAFT_295068 [Xylariaceae sp. FL1651]|nr:hypothetical protein F5Y19DRAFT_295068 [Xylariaceae sp. FL1651]